MNDSLSSGADPGVWDETALQSPGRVAGPASADPDPHADASFVSALEGALDASFASALDFDLVVSDPQVQEKK